MTQDRNRGATAGSILLGLNVMAVCFSGAMLAWGLDELSYEGEQWGLVAVFLLAGIGLLVELGLLVATAIQAKTTRGGSRRVCLLALGAILVAIGLDVGALTCPEISRSRHEQAFIDKSPMYRSGLRQAVLDGDVGLARAIIQGGGCPLWHADCNGQRVIQLAVKAGDRAMVDMLLTHGADPSTHDFSDISVLHLAVKGNHLEIARLLLDRGAEVNHADRDGRTALSLAQAPGRKEMLDLLTRYGGTGADYVGLLFEAVRNGDIRKTTELLARGMSVDTTARNGGALLACAAGAGEPQMARFLISKGASVDARDACGRTPLHSAAGNRHAEVVRYLVAQGADVNAQGFLGQTPLHMAISLSQFHEAEAMATVKALVDGGADLNARRVGQTPLEYAQTQGTDAIRAFLAERGGRE